ncbi:hypothetical protein BgAZ_107730 [Babesia gibsoni]|uniref:Uncharacterized protein n=1 Tax=Babesia gibsoni TaxID=33632 RepID=A0AAD8UUN9_BABGI|nr:hypothetical protein BgAZ_107730 [Babesia gibsoni]
MSGEGHGSHDVSHGIPGIDSFRSTSPWLRSLARNAGLYRYPHADSGAELSETRFEKLVKEDDPKSTCTPLLVQEHKCLSGHGFDSDPSHAATKCVKWYNEWMQCKWDEEKMKMGYGYMEDLPARKHRAYIAAPNYQYS